MAAQAPAVNSSPLISVIISVFNGEAFLKQAIDSILNQTYTNWELIIVDDGSTDASHQIIVEYNDERIRSFKNTATLGLTKSLNKAVGYANGKYIARMDADDICIITRFEKQVNYLQANTALAGVAGFIEFIDEENNFAGIWNDDRRTTDIVSIKRKLPYENCIAHPTVMIRKDILIKYFYNEDQKHSQDWDLWLRLFADGHYITKLHEVVLQYRLHDKSVTTLEKKQSSFKKKNEMYSKYLSAAWKKKKFNYFNFRVLVAYVLNKIMMVLSIIKRVDHQKHRF